MDQLKVSHYFFLYEALVFLYWIKQLVWRIAISLTSKYFRPVLYFSDSDLGYLDIWILLEIVKGKHHFVLFIGLLYVPGLMAPASRTK